MTPRTGETIKKPTGEAAKRQLAKELLIVTDENEVPVTQGSKVHAYLTKGMAERSLRSLQKNYPDLKLQLTTYVSQSSRLIFMDTDDE